MAGPRILVVDDNVELLTLLSSSFEEAGYAVQTAARGRAALDLARKEKPDLVVVDILLPDLMGYDVAEGLKRLRVPFIFMSGVHKGGKAASIALDSYGALAFFEKPFERRKLLDAVRKAVPAAARARVESAFDVESGPQVAEAAEAMQLTARIDLQSGSLQGTSPLQLKPMNRDQVARMREKAAPPAKPIRADKVNTGPIQRGSEPDPVLQPVLEREGIRRGELKDNLPHLLAAFYNAKETGELGLMKGQVKKIKLDIHPANLIMRGVKKLYKPERLKRLMPQSARPTPSRDPSFNLSDVELQAWEAHLLPRCDGSRSVAELVKLAGKPENDVLGTLVALASLRVLDLR